MQYIVFHFSIQIKKERNFALELLHLHIWLQKRTPQLPTPVQ